MFYNILFVSILIKKMIFLEKNRQKNLAGNNNEHIFAPAYEKKQCEEDFTDTIKEVELCVFIVLFC